MTKLYKRTRLLILKRFQIRYISLILLFMFATAILTGYTVYVTTWIMFGEKLAAVYPQGLLMDIVKKVNMALFLRLIFLSPLVIFIGLVLSHRIAGPIFSIKRFLNKVANGSYEEPLKLRKNDELQDVAESLNRLVAKLYSDRQGRREECRAIKREAEELESAVLAGKADREKLLKKITEVRADLDKIADS